MPESPEVTIVIPVHNEERILADSVAGLAYRLSDVTPTWELLIAENGSSDDTAAAAAELAAHIPQVDWLQIDEPNYGRALRQGIMRARGRWVVCDEIDLCDVDFYRSSLGLLRTGKAEMVVGSKLAPGARDERPWLRNVATRVLNGMLRVGVGFRGTDTHGLKAFERERLLPVVEQCVVEGNLFASELVIRAERAGVRITELPLVIREKRQTTINLINRVPRALYNYARLVYLLRTENHAPQTTDTDDP